MSFRINLKTEKRAIEENIPTFIDYFNLFIDRLIYQNHTNFKNIDAEDLMNTTKELNNFETELLKVIFFYFKVKS